MFKGFFTLLHRFIPPYKRYIVLNVIFNVLSAFLTLFSFALIIPILEMLFGMNQAHYTYMELGSAGLKEVVVNDFYYGVQCLIESYGPSTALAAIASMLVVFTGLKVGSAYLAAFNMITIRTSVVRDIRNQIYDKIVTLPIGFFSNERKGDIMGTVGKRLKRVSLDAQNQWGMLLSNIEETVGGLRIVKAFNAEDKVRKRFSDENNKYRRITQNMHRRYELAHPMSEFLGTATIAVVLWFGGKLILSGNATITAPSFIYYMVIFYSIINPAKDFSKASYAIQRGLASVDRIDKILKADDTIKDPEHPVPLKEMKQGIKYSNVRFRYGDQWVIDGINLEIGCGKTVALVGQSGSGKTTLADLLPRFYDVEEGSISIDGVDIRDVSKYDLRALMGNVNQEAILFNDTIRNNITFGVESATDEEVIAAAKIANAYDFIMATENGFDTNIGDRGCNLSGGQRQRLSIARAILKNPPILILDEATSALDTESEHLVQQALDNLMHGRTTVVIAHRLSTIKNADLICVLQDGKIIEQGTHDQLIAENGSYKHLVDLQKF